MEKNRKNKSGCLCCIIIVLFIMLSLVISIVLMKIGDWNYEKVEAVIDIFKVHHFKGDVWYSGMITLIGAVISATPGIFFGFIAYSQSERIHALESRYHRPALSLHEIQFKALDLQNYDWFDREKKSKPKEQSQDGARYESLKKDDYYALEFSIMCGLANDIMVSSVCVRKVTFIFDLNGKSILQTITLNKESNAQIIPHWEYIGGKNIMRCDFQCDSCECDWEQFNQHFINFYADDSIGHPDYEYIKINIDLEITHEFKDDGPIEMVLETNWEAKSFAKEGNKRVWKTSDGRLISREKR